MKAAIKTRVLVVSDDTPSAARLVSFLSSSNYDACCCAGLDRIADAIERWRPHVMVLAPLREGDRHAQLEQLRSLYPSMPVVILTMEDDQELLLDLEAFAPTLPATPSRGLRHIASTIAAASLM